MCVALNIVSGYPDGSFKPEGNITRAEFCKMICVMLNGGTAPATATNATPTFSDVRTSANASWAEGFIEYCYAKGIVSGVGNGKFNPNGNITGTEAAKMLLVALGYNATVEGYTGAAWALKVNVQANQDGLYDDLKGIDTNAALTRDNAAQMIWNALKAKIIEKNSSIDRTDGSITDIYSKGKDTLLKDKFNAIDDQSAQMVGFTYNSDKEEWTYYFSNTSTIAKAAVTDQEKAVADGNLAFAKFTSSTDYTDLYMQNVKVVYTLKSGSNSVDKVFGMYADDTKVLTTAYVGDFDTVKDDDDTVTISDVDFDLEAKAKTTPVYTFQYGSSASEAATTIKALCDAQANVAFPISAIDYDDNGDIDFFVVHKFVVDQVLSLGTKNFTLDKTAGTFKLSDVVTYKDMAEDDFVVYTAKAYSTINKDTFTKVDSVLKGKVTATKGEFKFAVDGTWYEATSNLGVEAGDNVKDAPVVNGYVFDADATGTTNIQDYVVVVGADIDAAYGDTVKLMFSDGTKKVVDLDEFVGVTGSGKNGAITAKDVVGAFFTYETNKDNEYKLTPAITSPSNNTNKESGFKYVTTSFTASDTNSSGKVKYIGGYNINDDAVIFMLDGSDYKVITGSQLKAIKGFDSTTPLLNVTVAYADENSSTGYKSVALAYVSTAASSVSADKTYGYVTADPITVRNSDDKNVTQLVIWTDAGKEVTLNTKANLSYTGTVAKGDIISYGVNGDNEIDELTILASVGSGAANTKTVSVTAYDGTYVQVNDQATRYEITKDSTIVYISATDSEGVETGSIKLASKTGKTGTGVEKYYHNAYLVLDGSDVDVLFVDINNDIDDLM